jgi:hypothetical protein
VTVAGVVNYDVKTAEVRVGALHSRKGRATVGDIQRYRHDRLAVPVGQILHCAGVAGSGSHRVAARKGSLGPATPESARGAGDEPVLAHRVFLPASQHFAALKQMALS